MADVRTESGFMVPKKALTVEFAVGLFMLAGVACFGYLAINIAKMKLLETGYYDLRAKFTNISGLQIGSPVEMAGVPIGEVKKISLQDTSAIVTMKILNGVKLKEDDIASIRTKGIIGDRYVRISPGGSDAAIVPGGSITDTESTVDIEEIIGKFVHSMNAK